MKSKRDGEGGAEEEEEEEEEAGGEGKYGFHHFQADHTLRSSLINEWVRKTKIEGRVIGEESVSEG